MDPDSNSCSFYVTSEPLRLNGNRNRLVLIFRQEAGREDVGLGLRPGPQQKFPALGTGSLSSSTAQRYKRGPRWGWWKEGVGA